MANAKIIVIGCGKLGSSIAKQLCRKGEDVLVIDRDDKKMSNLEDFSGYTLVGDACDINTLEENGIRNAKHVVIATNDDNTNLFLADVCHYLYGVPNIHVRLTDSRKAVMCDYESARTICPFDLSMVNFEEHYSN